MAKPIVGVTALLAAISDERLALDTPVSQFVEGWAADPVRSKVRVRELVTHTSGLDDVDFSAGFGGELGGWRRRYFEQHAGRFRMALSDVPFLFEPGSSYRYSGVGYYVLAYLLGRALDGGPQPDVETLLRDRILAPLGIPDEAWEISYRLAYDVDGMKLRAIGSGARFSARAVARVAALIARKGEWNGRQLIDAAAIEALLGRESRPPVSVDRGWFVNWYGFSPSLPPDAIFGHGAGQQVVVVVPSLALVMVRLGEAFAGSANDFGVLERRMFEPLMQSVRGGSPAR